jgi:hypothetical protein
MAIERGRTLMHYRLVDKVGEGGSTEADIWIAEIR